MTTTGRGHLRAALSVIRLDTRLRHPDRVQNAFVFGIARVVDVGRQPVWLDRIERVVYFDTTITR
jgi:hypothetical protein